MLKLPSNIDMRMLLLEYSDWQREHRFMTGQPRRIAPYSKTSAEPYCMRNEYAYRIYNSIVAMGYDVSEVLPSMLIEQAEIYRTYQEGKDGN